MSDIFKKSIKFIISSLKMQFDKESIRSDGNQKPKFKVGDCVSVVLEQYGNSIMMVCIVNEQKTLLLINTRFIGDIVAVKTIDRGTSTGLDFVYEVKSIDHNIEITCCDVPEKCIEKSSE